MSIFKEASVFKLLVTRCMPQAFFSFPANKGIPGFLKTIPGSKSFNLTSNELLNKHVFNMGYGLSVFCCYWALW